MSRAWCYKHRQNLNRHHSSIDIEYSVLTPKRTISQNKYMLYESLQINEFRTSSYFGLYRYIRNLTVSVMYPFFNIFSKEEVFLH